LGALLCHRCGRALTSGQGDFYLVRIEAYADPTPPRLSEDDLQRDTEGELRKLIEQMQQSERSEREWMDQVHRQLTLHLCIRCYQKWIEDPTGDAG